MHELFGDPTAIQFATPDSYGLHPPAYRLPPSTHIGGVTLQVSDLARSLDFYQHTLGFFARDVSNSRASLGPHDSDRTIIELVENRHAPPATARRKLGLFHVAILLPTRAALGQFLRHLNHIGTRAGAGDHLVSEALYLSDPDGLGIEVYADRERGRWKRRGQELVMATDPVDMRGLIAAAGSDTWTGMPPGTTVGHVHLHVGDIDAASRFYSDALGFDRMVWSYPGALFLAAGGYHHHLGTNTWAGAGALPPIAGEPQLLEWTLIVPTPDDILAVSTSARTAGFAVHDADDTTGAVIRDPWGTAVRVATAEAHARATRDAS